MWLMKQVIFPIMHYAFNNYNDLETGKYSVILCLPSPQNISYEITSTEIMAQVKKTVSRFIYSPLLSKGVAGEREKRLLLVVEIKKKNVRTKFKGKIPVIYTIQ